MSGVVHSSLDALVQGPVVGGQLVPQFGINGWSQSGRHAVVMLPQIRIVSARTKRENRVLQHFREKNNVFQFILSFSVPLFFFL